MHLFQFTSIFFNSDWRSLRISRILASFDILVSIRVESHEPLLCQHHHTTLVFTLDSSLFSVYIKTFYIFTVWIVFDWMIEHSQLFCMC